MTTTSTTVTEAAWAALEGAWDLHVHVEPDVIRRRIDDLDLAQEFLARRLKGFVLKSHYFPTAERAAVVTKAVPGIDVRGGLTLNHSVGGINPMAVELAGRSGCAIVWMPTVDAANETAHLRDSGVAKLPAWAEMQKELVATGINPPPMSVLDADGLVLPAVRTCLEIIAKHDMVLATAHLGRREIYEVVALARDVGVRKVVVTHPTFPSQQLTPDEQASLADRGALIEHCFTTTHTGKASWDLTFESIRRVGVERTTISSDLGQRANPPVTDGLGMFAQTLFDAGFSPDEVTRMAVTNPGTLVGS